MADSREFLRVRQHIGGLPHSQPDKNKPPVPRTMHIGGEGDDVLTLVHRDTLEEWEDDGVDIMRLIKLGALAPATDEEVARWEREGRQTGGGTPTPTDSAVSPAFTTGNETPRGAGQVGDQTGIATLGADARTGRRDVGLAPLGDAATSNTGLPNGMTKGELSEKTVVELKEMAKERGIVGYSNMTKAELLDALTAPPSTRVDDTGLGEPSTGHTESDVS
jgi:Zn ribbon nucleic-acid-binding protein